MYVEMGCHWGAAASLEGKISLGLRKGCFWHSRVAGGVRMSLETLRCVPC